MINELVGKIISEIKFADCEDEMIIKCNDGTNYIMYHEQDCCENVYIEDIEGDILDLIGSPILLAEEVTNSGEKDYDSYTWTFYKFATILGYVTIRWYGQSNGYYSESVDIRKEINL